MVRLLFTGRPPPGASWLPSPARWATQPPSPTPAMAEPPFHYQEPFPLGADDTAYELLTREHVSTGQFEGRPVLKVAPEGLALLAAEGFKAVNFMLRPAHLAQVAAILDDPLASDNDRMVALMLLRNAEIAAHGILPFCQDTGTASVVAHKGQQVWTGVDDAEWLSRGIHRAYTGENLRYSQNVPLTAFEERNTRTNLPAQIDIAAVPGDDYRFLLVAKGGGSANKTFLYQESRALLHPDRLREFCTARMRALGTAACPPYHLVFVVGGTSAEACLKTVKLASTGWLDTLPATGNGHGRAFRCRELEADLLEAARGLGIGAQFGGRHFALDVRVVRLPRHGASCPVGLGVSCSADRQAKAKITRDGIFLEALERNPGRFIPERHRDWRFRGLPIDLDRGIDHVRAELSKHPVTTAVALTGTIVVARDIAHARLRERLERTGSLPAYLKDHPVYYAGPAKTPHGRQPHGPLHRAVPTPRRRARHHRQGQPRPGGHRGVPETRRLLPRLGRRPRRPARPGPHPQPAGPRVPRARHGGGVEDHRRELPRLHPHRRQGQRLLLPHPPLPGRPLSPPNGQGRGHRGGRALITFPPFRKTSRLNRPGDLPPDIDQGRAAWLPKQASRRTRIACGGS